MAPVEPMRPTRFADIAQPTMAGLLAAAVGYASSFTLVLTGLRHVGATPVQAASGFFAMCIALAILNIALPLITRRPVSYAWSTPGAAFLATLPAISGGFNAVVGAFLMVAAMVILSGLVRPLTRLVAMIPQPIAAAMLGGVLLHLCLAPVQAAAEIPALALPALLTFVIGLRVFRRYAVPAAVAVAAIGLILSGGSPDLSGQMALPVLAPVAPAFTVDALVKIAVPLFVITMASQNLTGLAVLKANGFDTPAGPPFIFSGAAGVVVGLFGGLTINLAAITAALMAGPEAHPDPERRWIAPIAAGIGYLALALLASVAAAFVAASPPILIEAVAGLALLPSLASALSSAVADDKSRLPAVVAFVTAASGVTVAGIGGAFWGLIVGVLLTFVLGAGRK